MSQGQCNIMILVNIYHHIDLQYVDIPVISSCCERTTQTYFFSAGLVVKEGFVRAPDQLITTQTLNVLETFFSRYNRKLAVYHRFCLLEDVVFLYQYPDAAEIPGKKIMLYYFFNSMHISVCVIIWREINKLVWF